MDKENKNAYAHSAHDEASHQDEAAQRLQATMPHHMQGTSQKRQTPIDTRKLRRDLEASKKLHEEARAHKQRTQARLDDQFKAAQQMANREQAQPVIKSKAAQAKKTETQGKAPAHTLQDKPAAAAKDRAAHALSVLQTHRASRKEKKAQQENAAPSFGKRVRRRSLGCLFYVILFLCVICAAFAALWMVRAHNAPTPITEIPENERAAVAMEREKSNVYVLFAGSDQRADEASRSDTIIYAAIRPVDRKVEMVSIPRDSLVEIPEYGEDKINAAMAYGGIDLLVNTVENLVDNPVDHTVLINFQSFAKIIDAMGGITIDVPEKMYLPEEGIDLEAGTQKLSGEDALAFVRWRGDGLGDIGRMERQSQFMSAVMDKVRHLTPWRAVMTFWTVTHEIETDLSTFDLLRLAWNFIGMDGDVLEYRSFELNPTYIDGVSYVLLDDWNVNEVIQTMKYGTVIDDGSGYNSDDYYY